MSTQTQTEQTRAIVTDYFARFVAGDLEGAFGLISPDAVYEITGGSPISGKYTIPQVMGMFGKLGPVLKSMKTEVVSLIAEGDRAAVETRGSAALPNGAKYANQYHWAFEVRDGKITRVGEYMCTYHAMEVLAPLMAEAEAEAGAHA